MYKIGDFSQIAQVSVRMLRYYEKLGLLKPEHVDTFTSYRYYTLDQLSRTHRISALRDLGLSLNQVANLLDDPQADARLYEMLQAKRLSIEKQLDEEQARLDRVAARLKQIEQIHEPIRYDVALKSVHAMQIAALRKIVPHISQMALYRERILRQLYDSLKHENIIPGVELAIYHMGYYAEEDIDMSLAVELEGEDNYEISDRDFQIYVLPPASLAASVVYNGSLCNIPDVVANLYRWLGMNGYASAGVYRELHLSGRELDLFAFDPPIDGVIEVLVPIEKI